MGSLPVGGASVRVRRSDEVVIVVVIIQEVIALEVVVIVILVVFVFLVGGGRWLWEQEDAVAEAAVGAGTNDIHQEFAGVDTACSHHVAIIKVRHVFKVLGQIYAFFR